MIIIVVVPTSASRLHCTEQKKLHLMFQHNEKGLQFLNWELLGKSEDSSCKKKYDFEYWDEYSLKTFFDYQDSNEKFGSHNFHI